MLGTTSGLKTVPPETWLAVRDRLKEAGLGGDETQRVVQAAQGLWEPLRKAAQRWQASRLAGPAGTAMRLFFCGLRVPAAEAGALCGDNLLDACLAGGLLLRDGETFACPFDLHFVWPFVLFGDELTQGGDAVMVFGESTLRLYESALPLRKTGSVLDLGCGAGALALLLGRHAERAVGTDISRRAIQIAEFNAAFNGACGVEYRQGSLFEPVRGERFDLIVSQLPFVPRTPRDGEAVYLHGGSRGDELVLEAISGLGDHLTPGGRALFSVDWPEVAGDPLEHRLERALQGHRWKVLVLLSPQLALDYYAPEMAAYALGRGGPDYEAAATTLLDHLTAHQVMGFRQSVVVIEFNPGGAEWRQMRVVPPEYWRAVRRPRIDELFLTRDLLDAADDTLASSRLAPSEGAQVEQSAVLDGPGRETRLRFAPASLLQARRADAALLNLLDAFRGGRTPAENGKGLPEVREALRLGVIRPAPLNSAS